MKHSNSNFNIFKKNFQAQNIKNNNFLKPSISSYNININKAKHKNINNTNNNILINLLYKDKSKISLYSNLMQKYKYLTSQEKNDSSSISNSIYKEKYNRSNINIRLNLNNEIINNNFTRRSKSRHKSLNINMFEKIKEKDSLITKLQKDLLQSQELLNKLQKDKQRKISNTFISMKSLDNNTISKNIYKMNDFFTQTTEKIDKIIKTNYNKFNINNKNKKSKLKKNLSGILSNKKKYYSPKPNHKCFSSSPNRYYINKLEKYDYCLSLSKFTLRKKRKENTIIKQKQIKNYNRYYKTCRTKYPPVPIGVINEKKNSLNYLDEIRIKCDKLKNKANQILNNYVSLIDYFKYVNNKKV